MKKSIFFLIALIFFSSCESHKTVITPKRIEFEKTWRLSTESENGVEFKVEYDSLISNHAGIEKINKFVKSKILSFPFGETQNNSLQSAFESIVKEYKSFINDFPDSPISWSFDKRFLFVSRTRSVLSLKFSDYSFTGGAHGNFETLYFNFKLTENDATLLQNIFTVSEKAKIIREIKKNLRKKFGLKENEPFANAGLWQEFGENYKFNENFLVEQDSLKIIFNQYEIAPYSMGIIEVALPFESLPESIYKKIFE